MQYFIKLHSCIGRLAYILMQCPRLLYSVISSRSIISIPIGYLTPITYSYTYYTIKSISRYYDNIIDYNKIGYKLRRTITTK